MAEENKGVYFTELTLENVRCFGDKAVLKLSNDKGEWSRWNVILGDNGTGKTTLLQCLAGMELEKYKSLSVDSKIENEYWGPKLFNYPWDVSFLRIDNKKIEEEYKRRNYIQTIISSQVTDNYGNKSIVGVSQILNINKGNLSHYDNIDNFLGLYILGYGANRRISFQILSEKELDTETSATLFDDDAKLINTENWLYQMDYAAAYTENRNTNTKEYARARRDLAFKLIKEILPDIEDIAVVEETSSPLTQVIKFKTPYGWVRIRDLSYGYKTMVAWIVDVAAKMFKRYPDAENPLNEPVVILVDEIDLHLHPKWQRQIFDFLETRFPKAQFIVTAHSPLIVQSAPKEANIIVLKKEKVGDEYIVKIDNDIESVRNWRIDQIMSSDIFGLNTSRNPEIEKQLLERKKLLQKEKLNEDEEKRLDELNEISYNLPTADSPSDIEAMELIRKAAKFLKDKQK